MTIDRDPFASHASESDRTAAAAARLIRPVDVAVAAQHLLRVTDNRDARRGVAALATALGCTLPEVLR